MKQSSSPARYVQPIHFEDFDGAQFERLVFAYHARTDRWRSLEWFGQRGKDKGRDIVGIREVDGWKDGQCVCVLCANWRKLTRAKVKSDITKALSSLARKPDQIRIVCGHDIAAGLRDDAKKFAQSKGIYQCESWSGKEFEEFIRARAESLLLRFVHGDAFPDTAADLLMFAWGAVPANDDERLALIALAFDRPAFTTRIDQESSLPAFKKAITDTIQVLKTGVWETRDGHVIRRLPTKSDIANGTARDALGETEKRLIELRTRFDELVRKGAIRHCACTDSDCPVHMMDHEAIHQLTEVRELVLESFQKAYPSFSLNRNKGFA
jgi:hypothetical protein